ERLGVFVLQPELRSTADAGERETQQRREPITGLDDLHVADAAAQFRTQLPRVLRSPWSRKITRLIESAATCSRGRGVVSSPVNAARKIAYRTAESAPRPKLNRPSWCA